MLVTPPFRGSDTLKTQKSLLFHLPKIFVYLKMRCLIYLSLSLSLCVCVCVCVCVWVGGPKRCCYVWCYMGPNVTVMTDVTWARTLSSLPVLHGPEHYRYYRCYMGPNVTVITGVTLVKTLPL